jgi:hypothetical protein
MIPEFKLWFKGSLVVEANGDPKVVYRGEHGDAADAFQSRLPSFSFGSAEAASTYAQNPNNRADTAQAPRVFPVYLSIKNPIVNDPDDPFIDFSTIIEAVGEESAARIARRHEGSITGTTNWQDNFASDYEALDYLLKAQPRRLRELYMDAFRILDDKDAVDLLTKAGFDGAIYGGNGETSGQAECRVFDLSQIASIFSNHGTPNQKIVSAVDMSRAITHREASPVQPLKMVSL